MLDTVIFARDKWLRDSSHGRHGNGYSKDVYTLYIPAVYPNVCSMKVVAVSDKSERETRIDFWDSVYG